MDWHGWMADHTVAGPFSPGGRAPIHSFTRRITHHIKPTGHDWCIIKLAFPGRILGFDVDTSFFTGNFAPRCSIQAATVDDEPVRGSMCMGQREMGVVLC